MERGGQRHAETQTARQICIGKKQAEGQRQRSRGAMQRQTQIGQETDTERESHTQTEMGIGVERRGRGGQMGRKDQGTGARRVWVSTSPVPAVH